MHERQKNHKIHIDTQEGTISHLWRNDGDENMQNEIRLSLEDPESMRFQLDRLRHGNIDQFNALVSSLGEAVRESTDRTSTLMSVLNLVTRVEDKQINDLYTARFGEQEKRHIEGSRG